MNQPGLRIRALRPREEGPIRELDARLSPRSRYLRFLSPMPALPDAVVQLLASADVCRGLTLVAESGNRSRGEGETVGLASFCAIDDRHVELGIVVRDDWQRQRIGIELANRVIEAAEARGFHRFVAYVTADNVAIRRLLRKLCDLVSARADGAVSELVFVRRQAGTERP